MNHETKEEDGELFCKDHDMPIVMIIINPELPISERIICLKCLQHNIMGPVTIISISEAKNIIQQKKNIQQNKNLLYGTLNKIEEFRNNIRRLRSQVVRQTEKILETCKTWISTVQSSFNNNLIQNINLLDPNVKSDNYMEKVDSINLSYYERISFMLAQLKVSERENKCKDLLNKLTNNISIVESNTLAVPVIKKPLITVKILQNEKPTKQILKKITLINTVQQYANSMAITFNMNRSIMVTGHQNYIKLWKFNEGNLIEQCRLTGHSSFVLCFVFSKIQNWFISGSQDRTIRCWKEHDGEWKSSKSGYYHQDQIFCILLNQQEDQLISCSADNKIIVWIVDYETNKLQYDYKLEEKHRKSIYCMSMNKSETFLVSSGGDRKIILWGKDQNGIWEYNSYIKNDDYGYGISFINENKILWKPKGQSIVIQCVSQLINNQQKR